MRVMQTLVLALSGVLVAAPLAAHHSYALFDMTKRLTVTGTAAKLEWKNPHVFVWVYVPDRTQKTGYQLFAFEAGSLVVMGRQGWDRNTVKPGERLTVEYLPLKSGKAGGVLMTITHADGTVHNGDPYGRQLIDQIRSRGEAAK